MNIALLLLLCVQLPAVAQSDALPDTTTTITFYQASSRFSLWDSVGPPTVPIRADPGEHWRQNHRPEVRSTFGGLGQDADLVKLLLLWREYKASLGTDSVMVGMADEKHNSLLVYRKIPVQVPDFEEFMAYLESRIIAADSAGAAQ